MLYVESNIFDTPEVVEFTNPWDSYDTPIVGGFCHTGLDTSRFFEREKNYVDKHELANVVETQLSEMGLPFQEQDFLAGTGYDLLFLENHGLIAKVGINHDPIDFIHPCLSQPIGWKTDQDTGLTTCLYAGEELAPQTFELSPIMHWGSDEKFKNVLRRSGQGDGDVLYNNIGYITVNGESLPLLIDVDKDDNNTIDRSIAKRKQKLHRKLWDREGINNAESHGEILFQVYGGNRKLKPWMGQFDRHKDLRKLFWDAQDTPVEARGEALKTFWDTAAEWTRKPQANGVQLRRDYLVPKTGALTF